MEFLADEQKEIGCRDLKTIAGKVLDFSPADDLMERNPKLLAEIFSRGSDFRQ